MDVTPDPPSVLARIQKYKNTKIQKYKYKYKFNLKIVKKLVNHCIAVQRHHHHHDAVQWHHYHRHHHPITICQIVVGQSPNVFTTDPMFSQKFSPLSSLLEGGAATKKASKNGNRCENKIENFGMGSPCNCVFLHLKKLEKNTI